MSSAYQFVFWPALAFGHQRCPTSTRELRINYFTTNDTKVEECDRCHTFNLQYNVVFEWNKFDSVAVGNLSAALLQLEGERTGSGERNLHFECLALLHRVLTLF